MRRQRPEEPTLRDSIDDLRQRSDHDLDYVPLIPRDRVLSQSESPRKIHNEHQDTRKALRKEYQVLRRLLNEGTVSQLYPMYPFLDSLRVENRNQIESFVGTDRDRIQRYMRHIVQINHYNMERLREGLPAIRPHYGDAYRHSGVYLNDHDLQSDMYTLYNLTRWKMATFMEEDEYQARGGYGS